MSTANHSQKIQMDKPKKGWGVIYLVTCIANNKKYIGQANNYVSGNTRWGCDGRWKSHLHEAFGNVKDHCRLLNSAIRKYGKDMFMCHAIKEAPENELNTFEELFISEFNTLVPNGYNLTKGGAHFTASEETCKKQSLARLGVKRTVKATTSSACGHIGVKINRTRRHPEDVKLPKYICAMRKNDIIVGYSIPAFPIGTDKVEYVRETFYNRKHPEIALKEAEQFLNDLKEKYDSRDEAISKLRTTREQERAHDTIYDKTLKKCPEYVYPIINQRNHIDGYYVEGVPSLTDVPHPKEMFTSLSSNTKNKKAAMRYVKHLLDVVNKDSHFKEEKCDIDGNDTHKKSKEYNNLPTHITYIKTSDGNVIGYMVNSFVTTNGKTKQRKFCNTHIAMEEKFKMAVEYLEEQTKNIKN